MSEIIFTKDEKEKRPRSVLLVGENAPVSHISVREFKFSKPTGPYQENYKKIVPVMRRFFDLNINSARDSIWSDINVPVDEQISRGIVANGTGWTTYDKLIQNLVAPSVVTGDIVDLRITETTSDDLPKSMVGKFSRLYNRSEVNSHIEGYDSFYVVSSHLKLGRELASLACCVCIAPYMAQRDAQLPRHIGFDTYVEKFTGKGNEDLKIWEESVHLSQILEAEAKNNPFHGGSMTPR
jgi:hypothetical protein